MSGDYALPTRGQANWDDELNNSINNLRGRTDATERRAESAHSLASYALGRTVYGGGTPFFLDPDNPDVVLVIPDPLVAEDPTNANALLIG